MSRGVKQAVIDARLQTAYAATKPTNLVQPATYTNAAMREPLKAPVMQSPRADAGQHFEHASLGLGAQIDVIERN